MKKLITCVVTALLTGVYGMVVAPAMAADTPQAIPL